MTNEANTWKKGLPTVVGHYWFRNLERKDDAEPRVMKVRDYAGRLAIDNCTLEGCTAYEGGEWCGPLPLPQEQPPPARFYYTVYGLLTYDIHAGREFSSTVEHLEDQPELWERECPFNIPRDSKTAIMINDMDNPW